MASSGDRPSARRLADRRRAGAALARPTGPDVSGASRALRIIGLMLAPTTLLTALLFYFGMLHAYWFFQYFGVNYTVLGLTAQDFLIRSADGLPVPLTVVAVACLMGLWSYRVLRAWLPAEIWQAVARAAAPVAVGLGAALLALSLVAVAQPAWFADYYAVPGLCLAIGALLLVAGAWSSPPQVAPRRARAAGASARLAAGTRRGVQVAEWAAAFVLVSVGLFWAVGDYSSAVATTRARALAASLPTAPDVVVLSARSLNIQAPGVRQVVCRDPEAAYRVRYDGLKLVIQSGDMYLFLPGRWTPSDGVAILIPRGDAILLEFDAAATARGGAC